MKKNILYACVCEELVRYSCEAILGSVADKNMSTEELLDKCGVIAFCDKSEMLRGKKYFGKPVIGLSELSAQKFNKAYITSLPYVEEIYATLTGEYAIPEDKIVRRHIDFIRCARERFVYNIASDKKNREKSYDVAEGGVFKGDFSKVINLAFPNSRFYLFDTFSGFDKRDLESDKNYLAAVDAREDRYDALANTSVELVTSKLSYPEKAIIKKGYFPETAAGVEGEFIFVNLDFDLYAPTKAGLEFFYPQMVKGGTILIHDYFNSSFDAKKAVDEFCDENGLYPVPIGDVLSVAIIKQ